MISLDEAIWHCQGRALADCSECAKEHLQLAKWLEELKTLRVKSTPMKPEVRKSEVSGEYCRCPICKRVVGRAAPYCRMCGQALDWS